MIDREKVIKGLECCSSIKIGDSLFNDTMCKACPYSKPLGCGHDLAKDAYALLKDQCGWISVKDRMPPNDDTKVLTYGDPVTHWMPLPTPPEEVSGDG